MAYSYVRYTGNGSTTNYTFSFPTISTDHLKVRVNGALVTNWSFLNSSTIQFAAAPANAAIIEIRRETPKDSPIVNFTDGSVLLERDLDLLATYNLYVSQETEDSLNATIVVDSEGKYDADDRQLGNLAEPTDPQDAVTLSYLMQNYTNTAGLITPVVTMRSYVYVATAGQTVFTGADANSNTMAFLSPYVVVSLNGLELRPTVDYTLSGTGTITLVSGASVGDELQVQAFANFNVANVPSDDVAFTPAGTGAVATTVQAKLRETVSVKDFGAVGDGVADDTAAIQAAINAAGSLASIVYPDGSYRVASSITLLPQQHHIGMNARIVVDSGITAFTRTTDGFPGRIKFSDIRFEGTSNTGKAISITNNTPFVQLDNCYFQGFFKAVELSGSYCSNFNSCYFSYNLYGLILLNECHSTQLINCFFDGNTYAGFCVNGTPTDGNLGSNVHNITTVGCAFQNSEFGLWVESCYEFAAYSTYHEGNTKQDMRLGVGDAGTYGRFCYNFTIDSWQSSSPCGGGQNIGIEHAVGGNMRGLAFNAGCSTTATLLQVDGFSDKIEIDYHRFTTVTPTTTAPFNFIGSAAQRVVVFNDGRALYPRSMTNAIRFGTLAAQPEGIYSDLQSGSFRPALFLESVGANQDMVVRVTDLERHVDAANNLGFLVDHLNNNVQTAYQLSPVTDNTVSLGAVSNRWTVLFAASGTINTSDAREKQQVRTLSDAEKAVALKVKGLLRAFKFNDAVDKKGDAARIHFGVIAQEVKAAFESEGLIAESYAVLCYDEWEDQYDADKNLMQPSGNRYGVRYEELLAFIIAAL